MSGLFWWFLVTTAMLGMAVVLHAEVTADGSVGLRCYRLRFPREMAATDVLAFVAGLSGVRRGWPRRIVDRPSVTLEIHAVHGRISHFLLLPPSVADTVLSELRALLPGIRLEEVEPTAVADLSTASELRLSSPHRPLRTDRLAEVSATVLGSMQPLASTERVVMQLWLSPAAVARPPRLSDGSSVQARSLGSVDGYDLSPHGEALRAERDKQREPLFWCTLRMGVSAAAGHRSRSLLERIEASFQMLAAPGTTVTRRASMGTSRVVDRLQKRRSPFPWPMVPLNGAEVANVLGWPVEARQVPGIELGGCRPLPPAVDIPEAGYVIGQATYPGSARPIALAERDRDLHLSITGPTGSGKSNLLQHLIEHDMRNGRGCIVVDVGGNLVTDCLKRVPDERIEDVVLIDPSDTAHPVGLNLLATDYAAKELVSDQVTQTFHLLFEAFWGPRSDDLLRASLLTLMRDPTMTLVELVPLLTKEPFRQRFMTLVQDDPVGLAPFWAMYKALRPNEQAQVISPLMNKLRQILLRPMVMNCVGQSRPRLDLGEAVNTGKLVFVRLPEGQLGDEASSLLASLLVSRVWSIAQARVSLPYEERHPTTLYLDEAHRMVGSAISLDNMFAQARATRLSMVVATQHLTQWQPTELRQAVLSNARSKVVFQPTARDAQLYEAEFKPYLSAEDLQGLDRFEIVAQLATDQQVAPPVTARTLPPSSETGNEQQCREWSRTQYGRPRQKIEAELKARHAVAEPSAPIGRRKRGSS